MASMSFFKNTTLGLGLLCHAVGNRTTACRRSITRIRPRPIMPIKLKRRPPAPLVEGSVEPLIKVSNLIDQPRKFNVYEPDLEDTLENRVLEHEDYFQVRETVKLRELFDAGVHYGHKDGCRNDYMTPYLFGCRQGVDIFDLDKTVSLFQDALNFLGHIVYRGGIVLFICRNKQNMFVVEKAAREAGEYSHCRYWKGGLITNSTALYGGLTRLPDLCIFVKSQNSVFEEHLAITECARMMIPTIGIVDSDCDPRLISYPVPGNDDSPSAVKLYCRLFRDTILRAKEYKARDLAAECVLDESENETNAVEQKPDQKVESA